MTNLTDMLSKFVNSNTASTSGSGTLPSNTITNPKVDLKVVKRETEVTKDTVPPTNNGSTKDVQPPVVQVQSQVPNSEPAVAPVSAPMPNLKPSIPYPSRRNDEKRHEKANDQIEKFYKIFQDMSFKISLADALILMPKFASTLKALIGNKEKLSEMARTPLNEHCRSRRFGPVPLSSTSYPKKNYRDPCKFLILYDFTTEWKSAQPFPILALANLNAIIRVEKLSLPELTPYCILLNLQPVRITKPIVSAERMSNTQSRKNSNFVPPTFGNPTPYYDLIVSTSSPTLTPFGDSDFLLEEVDAFLALEDDPTSLEVDDSYYDPEGDILLLESFLNDDPSPLPNQGNYLPEIQKELKICKAKTDKSSIDKPPEVELKDLPPHLQYAFSEGDNKLPIIIAKET
ncbi:hypothetical protein Tco_0089910 [Tanacetum coccineum]